jgi:sulfide:quinone oxidoreductase
MSASRVLIVGGGVGALEAAIALEDLAGDRVEVAMYSPREDFLYRPFAVTEPYGTSHGMRYDLRPLAERCGAVFHRASIGSVDGEAHRARTHDGEEVAYDYLIVASGTRLLAGVSGAVTFWGVADDPKIDDVIADLRGGNLKRVAFAMPGGCSWTLPLYELALLAERETSKAGVDARLVIVTPEDAPLGVFGRGAAERVGDLLADRKIEVLTGATPVKFLDGLLTVLPSASVEADAVIALPRMEGRQIGGVPHDLEGFVRVDANSRIVGMQHAFAVGDVTRSPVKQGGLATQQADIAAEEIAAELGCDVPAAHLDPVLRGVLWTGAEPLYLSGDLAGGHGESSAATAQPPWEGGEEGKLVGRYLTPFFASLAARAGAAR